MRWQVSRSGATALALGLSFSCLYARPAAADNVSACVASSEKAQQLRVDHKLLEARKQFASCTRAECPSVVRKDCVKELEAVNAVMPSVIFRARDASGNDLTAVSVSVDGHQVASQLAGTPVDLDPGLHHFVFETAGHAPIDKQVLIAEAERDRELVVSFASNQPKSSSAPAAAPAPRSKPPVAAYVIGGVGAASVIAAPVFWALGLHQKSDDQKSCAPRCSDSEVSSIRSKLIVGDVLAGVGVVGLAIAGVLLIGHKSSPPEAEEQAGATSQKPPAVDVRVSSRGVFATLGLDW
jgi:hypothetical protein